MVTAPKAMRSHCPINFGLELFGDRWTLLVLRDLLLKGKSTYREFQAAEEGIATNILADRLEKLTRYGLVTARRDGRDSRLIRYEPTEACCALLPVLVEMAYWGGKHDRKTAAPKDFIRGYECDRDGLLASLRSDLGPRDA